jgi:hypothetical protein
LARVGELGGGEEAGGPIFMLLLGIARIAEKKEGKNVKNAKLMKGKDHVLPMCDDMSCCVEEQRTRRD